MIQQYRLLRNCTNVIAFKEKKKSSKKMWWQLWKYENILSIRPLTAIDPGMPWDCIVWLFQKRMSISLSTPINFRNKEIDFISTKETVSWRMSLSTGSQTPMCRVWGAECSGDSVLQRSLREHGQEPTICRGKRKGRRCRSIKEWSPRHWKGDQRNKLQAALAQNRQHDFIILQPW